MSSKKFHLAFAVESIAESVKDYSIKLSAKPNVLVDYEYALWRTETLNFSIRKVAKGQRAGFRHMGWENELTKGMTEDKDVNGIVWESFDAKTQMDEILSLWPEVKIL